MAEERKAEIAEEIRFEIYERAHKYRRNKANSIGGYNAGDKNPFELDYDEKKLLKLNKEKSRKKALRSRHNFSATYDDRTSVHSGTQSQTSLIKSRFQGGKTLNENSVN